MNKTERRRKRVKDMNCEFSFLHHSGNIVCRLGYLSGSDRVECNGNKLCKEYERREG